jgi:hypothetical protein
MGVESLPTPGKFVDDNLVQLYQDSIDQLIADLGQTITLYLPPTASGCPNCLAGFDGSSQGIYDNTNPFTLGGAFHKPFPNGGLCPVCKGTHLIKTPRTAQYTALIQSAPKDVDYTAYGKSVKPQNVFKTKTLLVAIEDIKITEKALIDSELCVILGDPIRRGLRDRRYTQALWERIDG